MPSEVLTLQWRQVDLEAGIVRLDPGTTKNREGRVFPFNALPELAELLSRQRTLTDALERETGQIVPYVFHRRGQRIRPRQQVEDNQQRGTGERPNEFRKIPRPRDDAECSERNDANSCGMT